MYRDSPEVFQAEAKHQHERQVGLRSHARILEEFEDVEESDVTDSRFTFRLGRNQAYLIVSENVDDLVREAVAEGVILPYYTLTLFDSWRAARLFLSKLPPQLATNKQLVNIWLESNRDWRGLAPYLTQEQDPHANVLKSEERLPSKSRRGRSPSSPESPLGDRPIYGSIEERDSGDEDEPSIPAIRPSYSRQIKDARVAAKVPPTPLSPSIELKCRDDTYIPDTKKKLCILDKIPPTENIPLAKILHDLKDPRVLIESRRDDRVGALPGSRPIWNLAAEPQFSAYTDYFSTIGRQSSLAGIFKTYVFIVNTEFTPSQAVLTKGAFLQPSLPLSLPSNSKWEGVEWLLSSSSIPTYSSEYLAKALGFTQYIDKGSDASTSYYQIFAEYASYDEDFNQFNTQEYLLASLTLSPEGVWTNRMSNDEVYDSLSSQIILYPSLAAMLEAAGSGTQSSTSVYLLTNRIKIKVSNYVRCGGDNARPLSLILSLIKDDRQRGIKTNIPQAIGEIGFVQGTYIACTRLGIVTTKPTKVENDCYFQAILPYIRDSFTTQFPDKRTKSGKQQSVTVARLREHYASKYGRGRVSLENATIFADDFSLYLLIVDERGDLINSAYLRDVNTRGASFTTGTILLYQDHYFTVHAERDDILRTIKSAIVMPEKSKNPVYGHGVSIDLKAFIDFETVYDTNTVEQSLRTYSGSIYPVWGDVNIKTPDLGDMEKYAEFNNAVSLVKGMLTNIPPSTFISPIGSEHVIISKIISTINSLIGEQGPALQEVINTCKLHSVTFNVIFIAYNGARFDFMPLFRTLNNLGYKYDTKTPVSGSGKMTKFKFYDLYQSVSTLWPTARVTRGKWIPHVFKSYSVWDPNCFLTGSLSSVLKSYGIKDGKLSFNHEEVQKAYESEEWESYLSKIATKLIAYNERDVTSLSELVSKVEEEFKTLDIDVFRYPTISSLSYAIARGTSILKSNVDISVEGFDLKSYAGVSDALNASTFEDIDTTFSQGLSRVTDEQDLMIRKAVIAGRVSSGLAGLTELAE